VALKQYIDRPASLVLTFFETLIVEMKNTVEALSISDILPVLPHARLV
jgi:hypothetical protein